MTHTAGMPRGWTVRVPATAANLGPGFDCFGLAFARYLTLSATVATGENGSFVAHIEGEGASVLPTDKSNLIYRAMLAGFGGDGSNVPALSISVENDIPLSRGLGSSAAATVAGIAIGQLLSMGKVDLERLVGIAAHIEGHADNVAAAAYGGLIVARGDAGSPIQVRHVPTAAGATFVCAVPAFELSTSDARHILPTEVSLADAVFNLRAASWMIAAWAAGDWPAVAEAMDDRLHQAHRTPLIHGFDAVRDAARNAGALGVCVAGSGPTVLALTIGDSDAVASAMVRAWAERGIECTAAVASVDTDGILVTELGVEGRSHE